MALRTQASKLLLFAAPPRKKKRKRKMQDIIRKRSQPILESDPNTGPPETRAMLFVSSLDTVWEVRLSPCGEKVKPKQRERSHRYIWKRLLSMVLLRPQQALTVRHLSPNPVWWLLLPKKPSTLQHMEAILVQALQQQKRNLSD